MFIIHKQRPPHQPKPLDQWARECAEKITETWPETNPAEIIEEYFELVVGDLMETLAKDQPFLERLMKEST